jgi:hypothetical protein
MLLTILTHHAKRPTRPHIARPASFHEIPNDILLSMSLPPSPTTSARCAYTVRASLPTEALRSEYLHWLTTDHVQKVLDAGALRAEVITLDLDPAATDIAPGGQVEVRYIFRDRAALERYIKDHAPRLRAEGATRFPADQGLKFQRSVGLLVCRLPEGYSDPRRRAEEAAAS